VQIVATAVVGDVPQRAGRRGKVTRFAVLGERLLGRGETVHVALMVRVVVPRQHLFGDVEFECIVVVRKRWQFRIGVF